MRDDVLERKGDAMPIIDSYQGHWYNRKNMYFGWGGKTDISSFKVKAKHKIWNS